MEPGQKSLPIEFHDDTAPLLRWSKVIARLAAWSATVGGAVMAFFSSSSVSSGVAITAAGASTLAAAEKIPDPKKKYLKTKHIPPLKKNASSTKAVPLKKGSLFNAALKPALPEKEAGNKTNALSLPRTPKAPSFIQRRPASFESTDNKPQSPFSASGGNVRSVHSLHTDDMVS